MRVLLTGGCGFIGSHITDRLIERGYELLVIDNHTCAGPPYIRREVEYLVEDIVSEVAFQKVISFRPNAVIHLAAQMDVRFSVEHPELDARINVEGTVRMLETARRAGATRFVMASSGGAIYGDAEPLPADENHTIEPESAYGTSKYAGELYLGYYNRLYGLNTLALRLANVYGPRQSSKGEAGVVAIFCMRLIEGKPPIIFGDGSQTRDYAFVENVADAFVAALEFERINGALNIGTGIETSVNQLYEYIRASFGVETQPIYEEARLGELARSCINPAKAMREIGFKPSVDLNIGIKRTVEWAKANYETHLKKA